MVRSGGAVVRSIEVRRAEGARVSIIATGDSADATPAHDQVVAATARLRSSTAGMLRTLAQKTADTPDSSAAPAYHASVNAIPRRGHGGSTASISTTAKPSRCSRWATALPISSQPSTIATDARFGSHAAFSGSCLKGSSGNDRRAAFPECDSRPAAVTAPPRKRHRAVLPASDDAAGLKEVNGMPRFAARSREVDAEAQSAGRTDDATPLCCQRRRKTAVPRPAATARCSSRIRTSARPAARPRPCWHSSGGPNRITFTSSATSSTAGSSSAAGTGISRTTT